MERSMNGDKHVQGPPKGPQAKRGRKPKRTIRTLHCLVAEVEAEVAELMKKNRKRKRLPVRQAIKNCLKHDTETLPHSWWWKDKDDVPLGLELGQGTLLRGKSGH